MPFVLCAAPLGLKKVRESAKWAKAASETAPVEGEILPIGGAMILAVAPGDDWVVVVSWRRGRLSGWSMESSAFCR